LQQKIVQNIVSLLCELYDDWNTLSFQQTLNASTEMHTVFTNINTDNTASKQTKVNALIGTNYARISDIHSVNCCAGIGTVRKLLDI